MPHSVSPEPEPPIQSEIQMEEPSVENGNSQHTEGEDDIPMADVGTESGPPPTEPSESKKEVKLEDLFADIDEDEEFPSSREPAQQTPSSSQNTPSSPG